MFRITYNGREETVTIKYSIATDRLSRGLRLGAPPGSTDYGRHARHNMGSLLEKEEKSRWIIHLCVREVAGQTLKTAGGVAKLISAGA